MTPNEQIVQSAYTLLRGEIGDEPTAGGYCLAMVRVVIEHAFYGGQRRWYGLHRSHIVERGRGADSDPWARDLERSLTRQGMALSLPRTGPEGAPERHVDLSLAAPLLLPGDLLFRFDTAKHLVSGDFVGHVGILMPGGLVLENVSSRPGALQRGPTTLSRLGAWPISTVARFQPA